MTLPFGSSECSYLPKKRATTNGSHDAPSALQDPSLSRHLAPPYAPLPHPSTPHRPTPHPRPPHLAPHRAPPRPGRADRPHPPFSSDAAQHRPAPVDQQGMTTADV